MQTTETEAMTAHQAVTFLSRRMMPSAGTETRSFAKSELLEIVKAAECAGYDVAGIEDRFHAMCGEHESGGNITRIY